MAGKYYSDQVLSFFHSWLVHNCSSEISSAELLVESEVFHPNIFDLCDSGGRSIIHLDGMSNFLLKFY